MKIYTNVAGEKDKKKKKYSNPQSEVPGVMPVIKKFIKKATSKNQITDSEIKQPKSKMRINIA